MKATRKKYDKMAILYTFLPNFLSYSFRKTKNLQKNLIPDQGERRLNMSEKSETVEKMERKEIKK